MIKKTRMEEMEVDEDARKSLILIDEKDFLVESLLVFIYSTDHSLFSITVPCRTFY